MYLSCSILNYSLFIVAYARRSIPDEEETPVNVTEETFVNEEVVIEQISEDIIPMPFDLEMELSHIKAHRQK